MPRRRGVLATIIGLPGVGQSFVFGLTPRLNVLVETLFVSTERRVGGTSTKEDALLLSPGVRWGLDLPHDVQVVLGLAAPLGVGPSAGTRALFAYLSVELPYWHPAETAAAIDAPDCSSREATASNPARPRPP